VWDSAAALSAEEYSLLDLHLRRDLSADELAEHMGLNGEAVHTRLFAPAWLVRGGHDVVAACHARSKGCAQLDAVVSELGPERATSEVRKAVREHLRECEQCQESGRRFVSSSGVLGSLAQLSATRGLRERIRKDIDRPRSGLRARLLLG
jgi:hypothetical protein